MNYTDRKKLNQKIHALAHGPLGLTRDDLAVIVTSCDGKSEGHVSRLDDEMANLCWLQLKKMAVNSKPIPNPSRPQQKMIARLMDYLKWDWKATAEFCLKITGKKNTKDCSTAELSKIIRGMIAVIDHDIAAGKILLNHTQMFEYKSKTGMHRGKPTPGPSLAGGESL